MLIVTSAMKTILEDLDFLIKADAGLSKTLDSDTVLGIDGPVAGCKRTMDEMKELFPDKSTTNYPLGTSKSKVFCKALAWVWNKSRAKKLLNEMGQHRTLLILAITTGSRWVPTNRDYLCSTILSLLQP
jgi:hypothetical protein